MGCASEGTDCEMSANGSAPLRARAGSSESEELTTDAPAVSERAFADTVLVWMLAGLAACWIALWVYGSYFGWDAFAAISFYGAETPCGVTAPFTVGRHTFGDFALPWFWASSGDPWSGQVCAPSNYPATAMLPFSALTLLPYGAGLLAWEGALALALLSPFWWATRGAGWKPRLGAMSLATMSAPVTMVLDRGNIIGLLVPPLTLLAWGWSRSRWVHVAVGTGLATALKLYPAMFFMVLIANRKWRILASAIACTALVIIAVWAAFPGPVADALRGFQSSAGGFGEPTIGAAATRNYSLLGGILALVALGSTPLDQSPIAAWLVTHPWVPGLAYLAGCFVLIIVTRRATLIVISLTLAALQLVPPVNYRYYSVFALVIAALVLRSRFHDLERLGLPTGPAVGLRRNLLVASLVLTLLPLPLISDAADTVYPTQALFALPWVALLIVELPSAAWAAMSRRTVESAAPSHGT